MIFLDTSTCILTVFNPSPLLTRLVFNFEDGPQKDDSAREGHKRRRTHVKALEDYGFPKKKDLDMETRLAIASVNLVRAIDREGPIFCETENLELFRLIENPKYKFVLRVLVLLYSMYLPMEEPPPTHYGLSSAYLREAGYFT